MILTTGLGVYLALVSPSTPALQETQYAYNDYLDAAAIVDDGTFDLICNWREGKLKELQGDLQQAQHLGNTKEIPRIAEQIEIGKRLESQDLVGRRAFLRDRYERALVLVQRGNSKGGRSLALVDPPFEHLDVLSSFTKLVKLGASSAYVDFATRSNSRGIDTLGDMLQFCQRTEALSTLHFQRGLANEGIVVDQFAPRISHFTIPEAESATDRLSAALSANTLEESLKNDLPLLPDVVKALVTQSTADSTVSSSFLGLSLSAQLKRLDRSEIISEVQAKATELLKQRYTLAINRLDGPEEDWLKDLDTSFLQENWAPETPQYIGQMLANSIAPDLPRCIQSFARSRTRLRLMRLECWIREYLWRWDRLPRSLGTAPLSLKQDMLAGGEFHYEITSPTTHKLYSTGIPGFGRVDLSFGLSRTSTGSVPPQLASNR